MSLNFKKGNGLIPAVIQDQITGKVLMLGFMNQDAYTKTRNERKVTFFSRSKNRLWTKGETSGNYLNVIEIFEDCDQDALLIKVKPEGPVCHTGADTCFNEINREPFSFIKHLEKTIHDRKVNPREGSYTSALFKKGVNKVAQKVGEEAVELVIEAKDKDDKAFINEAADLFFHYLVLLEEKAIPLEKIIEALEKRHK
jgi:phosphoribosyl-AMP cyclohydrolase / phosphoribosyl-ATP pyrophosphohydrolase